MVIVKEVASHQELLASMAAQWPRAESMKKRRSQNGFLPKATLKEKMKTTASESRVSGVTQKT